MRKQCFFACLIIASLFINTDGTTANRKELRLSFTGDIIPHTPLFTSAKNNNKLHPKTKITQNNNGFDFLFDRIRSRLSNSDLTLANMEFPVVPPYISKEFVFNCHPSIIPAMKKAGISAVTIANNHIMDQGIDGVVTTIEQLKTNGIKYIGAGLSEDEADAGLIYSAKNISVGLLAATGVSNKLIPKDKQVFVNWFYNEEKMLKQIAAIKKKSDYIILVVHTGVEYKCMPEEHDRRLMKTYLNAGVDLIIGHHAHLVQVVETYTTVDGRETCIFYGLGNFMSNQTTPFYFPQVQKFVSTQNGIIVTVNLTRGRENMRRILKAQFDIIPVKTINLRTPERIIQTAEFEKGEETPPVYLLDEINIGYGRAETLIKVLNKKIMTKKFL